MNKERKKWMKKINGKSLPNIWLLDFFPYNIIALLIQFLYK